MKAWPTLVDWQGIKLWVFRQSNLMIEENPSFSKILRF